jgi:nitroreductase
MNMDAFEALYTTRAMRRVRPDPIPADVQARIIDAAIRAPSGGNVQGWRFLLVDDPKVRAQLAPLYSESISQLWATAYKGRLARAAASPDDPESIQMMKVKRSADWLGDNFETVPLLLFALIQGDDSDGSLYPAVWSAQLAARALGVGSSLTSVLSYFKHDEVRQILGVPEGKGWRVACMATFGYPLGRWAVAPRRPAHEVTYRNHWGAAPGFTATRPMWP